MRRKKDVKGETEKKKRRVFISKEQKEIHPLIHNPDLKLEEKKKDSTSDKMIFSFSTAFNSSSSLTIYIEEKEKETFF